VANPRRIIIDLPEDTDQDRSMAILRAVTDALDPWPNTLAYREHPGTSQLQRAYQKLLDMHQDTLLTHGGQVAQGLALAIATIAKMYPEVQEDRP
jgi:hypothetical protein